MLEGSVHIRSVPVIMDATPDSRVRVGHGHKPNNSPAPTDRRRLPVNRDIDIVGTKDTSLSMTMTGAKGYYTRADVEAQPLSQSETAALMAHMRLARDLRMMIR
jgi:hypothetical protein